MADALRVDVHMHLYPSAASGDWWKAGYEIWEYGEKEGVRFSRSSGTVGDALAALEGAGFSHGIAVNLLSVDLFREEAVAMLPDDLQGEDRAAAVAEIEATMAERFRAANRWLVDALAPLPRLTPYVGVDPSALSPDENVEHLREDRKSTRLNSSHRTISYAVFCLKKKKQTRNEQQQQNKQKKMRKKIIE